MKTRSWNAVAAWFRKGAGPHGGTKKQKHKRDRANVKSQLREKK